MNNTEKHEIIHLLFYPLVLVLGFFLGMSPLSRTGAQLHDMVQGTAEWAEYQVGIVEDELARCLYHAFPDADAETEVQEELLEGISSLKAACCYSGNEVLRELDLADLEHQRQVKDFFTELENLVHDVRTFTRIGDTERQDAGKEVLLQVYQQVFEDVGPGEGVGKLTENISLWRAAGGTMAIPGIDI